MSPRAFVALDFETADHGRDSACAVGLVRVEQGRIVRRHRRLIRPPRKDFFFTSIHGIRWVDVEREPAFAEVWRDVAPELEGAEFIAAHNASFDRSVLAACLRAAGLDSPPQPFVCTVRLARKAWNLRPANLPAVCRALGLTLNHHEALSDAEACANIVMTAVKQGAFTHEN